METLMEEKTVQAADLGEDMAVEAPEPAETAYDRDEDEIAHFAGQTMTAQRAALLAFQASSEGMGV